MNKQKQTSAILVATFVLAGMSIPVQAENSEKIAKCQDAQGHWHYGDSADPACDRSKVTVINDKGLRIKEISAPLTAEELRAQEKNQNNADAQRRKVEEEARKDRQLLATYANEDDIRLARERRNTDLEATMRASSETINTLRATLARMQAQPASPETTNNITKTEAQIQRHEAALAETKKQQEEANAQFDADLKRYRELKNTSRLLGTSPSAAQR